MGLLSEFAGFRIDLMISWQKLNLAGSRNERSYVDCKKDHERSYMKQYWIREFYERS